MCVTLAKAKLTSSSSSLSLCLHLSLHLADHQGPEAADHRGRDAPHRLVHPHLLASGGPTEEDGGGVQLGG